MVKRLYKTVERSLESSTVLEDLRAPELTRILKIIKKGYSDLEKSQNREYILSSRILISTGHEVFLLNAIIGIEGKK